MNSSTSNFRSELKVIAVVLLMLLVCELAMRSVEESLSLDVRHIREIPAIAEKMTKRPGTRVLFMGNSLTRCGIDEKVFTHETKASGLHPLSLATVYPDASSILIWHYVLKNFFINSEKKPDVLVINFAVKHLQDGQPFNVPAMGSFYTGLRDTPEVFAKDISNFGDRTEFLLSSGLCSFANRARVSPRVLDFVAPHYRTSMERINMTIAVKALREKESAAPTYQRLSRLLQMAADHKIHVIIVAMPVSTDYLMDPQVKTTVEKAGMTFLDARVVDGLSPKLFPDGYHMGPEAAAIYSKHLAHLLLESLRTATAQRDESQVLQ